MGNEHEVEQTVDIKGNNLKKTGLYTVKDSFNSKPSYIARVGGKFPFFAIEFINIKTFNKVDIHTGQAVDLLYTFINI